MLYLTQVFPSKEYYIKMDQENIIFFKNQGEWYNIADLYLNNNVFFGYKDSYNYYDFDVDKILLLKKSNNEYIIRYNEVNKMTIVPLQLKIKIFFWWITYIYKQ